MADRPETQQKAFKIVCSMEEASTAASDFVRGIAMLCETIDQKDGVVIQRIAWAAKDSIKAFEEKRCELFELLLPADQRPPPAGGGSA